MVAYMEDEVIDTLSLSDLLIYDINGDPQDFYRLDRNQNPNNIDVDDQFEFSSELLKTSMVNNSVVFCGKIIPYKEPSISQNSRNLESKKLQNYHKPRWWIVRFFKKLSKCNKSNIDYERLGLKYKATMKRVSILDSGRKPKWYVLMFGFGSSGLSAQIQSKDLKKRQTSMGKKHMRDNKISGGTGGGTGSWWLVKLLGCGGGGGGVGSGSHGGCHDNHHPNAIMKIEGVN